MSVYVDPIMGCVPNENWKWCEACHLYADTLSELHSFANRLGLKREWFQNKQRLPHYGLTRSKRRIAISMGAVEHTSFQMVDFIHGRLKK